MPLYNYECNICTAKFKETVGGRDLTIAELEEHSLFETKHPMKPTPEELAESVVCPRCQSQDCDRSFHGTNIIGYVRGYGFLDRVGCKRDMNVYKLTQDDPYGVYRQGGEVDHIKNKLQKMGQHQPNTIYSVPEADMKEQVAKAVFTKTDESAK